MTSAIFILLRSLQAFDWDHPIPPYKSKPQCFIAPFPETHGNGTSDSEATLRSCSWRWPWRMVLVQAPLSPSELRPQSLLLGPRWRWYWSLWPQLSPLLQWLQPTPLPFPLLLASQSQGIQSTIHLFQPFMNLFTGDWDFDC